MGHKSLPSPNLKRLWRCAPRQPFKPATLHRGHTATGKMKFSLVAVTALLSSVAFASPIAHADSSLAARAAKKPDQGALVAQDFEVIAQQTTLLNQTLNIFHRGGRSVVIAYRIRKQALNITATLKKTITDNSNSGNFSVDNTNLAVGKCGLH